MININTYMDVPNIAPKLGVTVPEHKMAVKIISNEQFDHVDVLCFIDNGYTDLDFKSNVMRASIKRVIESLAPGDRVGLMNVSPDVHFQWHDAKSVPVPAMDELLSPLPDKWIGHRDACAMIDRVFDQCAKWHASTKNTDRLLKVIYFTDGMDFTDPSTINERMKASCLKFPNKNIVLDVVVVVPSRYPVSETITAITDGLDIVGASNGNDGSFDGFLETLRVPTSFGFVLKPHQSVKILSRITNEGKQEVIKPGEMIISRESSLKLVTDYKPDSEFIHLIPEIVIRVGKKQYEHHDIFEFTLDVGKSRIDNSFNLVEVQIEKEHLENELRWQRTRADESMAFITSEKATEKKKKKIDLSAYISAIDNITAKLDLETKVIDAEIRIEKLQTAREIVGKKKDESDDGDKDKKADVVKGT